MPKKSTIQVFIYNNARFSCQSKEKVLSTNAFGRFLFLSGFSFTNIIDLQDSREGIYLTFLNHFHLLHRHLNISRAITAESSPLQELTSAHSEKPDSNREPLVSESKLLTTKLSALKYEPKKIKMENLIDDDLEKSSSDESSESDNDSNDEKVMMNPMNNLLKVF